MRGILHYIKKILLPLLMDIGTRTIILTGSLALVGLVDFKRELDRLKKLKIEQDAHVQSKDN